MIKNFFINAHQLSKTSLDIHPFSIGSFLWMLTVLSRTLMKERLESQFPADQQLYDLKFS